MLLDIAKKYSVPVLISQDSTSEFMAEVIRWLGVVLAPSITIHGVLVDVFGEGILLWVKVELVRVKLLWN